MLNRDDLTRDELAGEAITELPARTEMSLVNANVAAPINLALAANVLSDHAVAQANAQQTNFLPQGI